MSSTLGCIGLDVADVDVLDALVGRLIPDAEVIAESGDLQARRWIDSTGASLTMTLRASGEDGGILVDLVPSYVEPSRAAGVRVGALVAFGPTLAADLVDERGETLTRVACDLAQSIVAEVHDARDARLTALGIDVTVHADAAAFEASDASLLGTADAGDESTRFATESLLSYGLFADPEKADPTAFVSGTVLAATTHVNGELEQSFHAVRLRTVCGEIALCLAATDHPDAPEVDTVISGICYLVLDVPDLW